MTTETSNTPRYIIHVPDAWQRLISVIRHQASPGKFIFIDAPRQAGKTTFAAILKKKLALSDDLDCVVQQLHALSSYEQIIGACPEASSKLPVIILDDADDIAPDTLEKLITQDLPCFWVILAEPNLVDRLPKLQHSKFTLPLFSKTDCHKLLNKLMKSEDINLDVPVMEAELIYYESRGNPRQIVAAAPKVLEKLQRRNINMDSFDLANRGILSTAIIAIGVLAFIVYVVFFSGDEKPASEKTNQPTQDDSYVQSSDQTSGELVINSPSETIAAPGKSSQISSKSNPQLESLPEKKQQTGELLLGENTGAVANKPMSFAEWLEVQNPKDYTIQVYSNHDPANVEQFVKDYQLENTQHYAITVNGKKVHRLLWGTYENRARAQLAIKQLPEKLRQQKPWIRSLSAVNKELAQ